MSKLFVKENILKWNKGDTYLHQVVDGKLLCITCGRLLPLCYFRKRNNTKRGYNTQCKICYKNNKINIEDGEVFKDCVGYERHIKVSNHGRVLKNELIYENADKLSFKSERILKQRINKGGYAIVTIHVDGKTKVLLVHRLVALAFIENEKGLPCINHKDENKLNNKVENLEWCDRKYNNNYGTRNERISQSNKGVYTEKMKRHLEKIRDESKIPVIQLDKDGNYIRCFSSISEAQNILHNKGIATALSRGKNFSKGCIFRKINKDLFLALSALRDDQSYMQWFTDGNDYILCDRQDWIDMYSTLCSGGKYTMEELDKFHKATAQELIQYFKDR